MTSKRIAEWLELIGGSRPPPSSWNRRDIALARAAWWILLLLMTWAFAGRGTKFIYVDF
jgi:hypothetical protein